MTRHNDSTILEEKILVHKKEDTKDQKDVFPQYSEEICDKLEQIISQANLIKKYHPSRYDKGKKLHLDIIGVYPAISTKATFEIEKFIGGGFAGQVYRVRLIDIENNSINLSITESFFDINVSSSFPDNLDRLTDHVSKRALFKGYLRLSFLYLFLKAYSPKSL